MTTHISLPVTASDSCQILKQKQLRPDTCSLHLQSAAAAELIGFTPVFVLTPLGCVSTPLQLCQTSIYCSRHARLLFMLDATAQRIRSKVRHRNDNHLVNFHNKSLQPAQKSQKKRQNQTLGTPTLCLFVVVFTTII